MLGKHDAASRPDGREHSRGGKKQARRSYDQSHPSRPKDIFDIYTTGQKQHERKHSQTHLNPKEDHPASESSTLDHVALFTQLCFNFEHDPAFSTELCKLAGVETTNTAMNLAKQINSQKGLLSGIASQRPHMPHNQIESRKCPTLEAWFDRYPDALPALPPILDHDMESKVFTASSSLNHQDRLNTLSYERLEWLGDAYLELITRRIVFHVFVDTTESLPAIVTQDFVRNENLARFALAYGFDERLRIGSKHIANSGESARKMMTKTYGDVFEAYIAAVIESDPGNGYQTAYQWISALIKPTVLKYKQIIPVNPMAKEELAKKVLGRGIRIDYAEHKAPTQVKGGYVHYHSAYISGWGYKRHFLGSGEGPSKSHAQVLAAMEALTNPTTAVICAVKKEYDALVKIEREKEGGPDPEVIAALDRRYKDIPVE